MQGLIIENKANLYKIKLGDINYIATARGKFKNDSFTPVVGDIAEFSIVDENKKTAWISNVKMANSATPEKVATPIHVFYSTKILPGKKSQAHF